MESARPTDVSRGDQNNQKDNSNKRRINVCCDLALRKVHTSEKNLLSPFSGPVTKTNQRTVRYRSPNAIVAQPKNCLMELIL